MQYNLVKNIGNCGSNHFNDVLEDEETFCNMMREVLNHDLFNLWYASDIALSETVPKCGRNKFLRKKKWTCWISFSSRDYESSASQKQS